MGLCATIASKALGLHLVEEIIKNELIYMIVAAVLVAGFIFKALKSKVQGFVDAAVKMMGLRMFMFLLIVILGILSSVITAIIAALLLVEMVVALPISRKDKINTTIVACFSIGLGAVLTPIGEPLSTIVTSKLNGDFLYLFNLIGVYILVGVVAVGIFGAFFCANHAAKGHGEAMDADLATESNKDVLMRGAKIFLFIVALELLGAGFKPVIDTYIVKMGNGVLFWLNMISAILDNATLAAAEISTSMSLAQITAVLMGLLISGGMLIPGNIPNIISAGKLNISSKEWAKLGVPLGLVIMGIYYVVLFVI